MLQVTQHHGGRSGAPSRGDSSHSVHHATCLSLGKQDNKGTVCLGALIAILVCHQPATDARTMNKLSTFLRFCAIRTGLPACTASERNTVDSKGRKHFADTALGNQGTVRTCQELSSYHPRKAGQNISTKKSDHSWAPKRKAWVKEAIGVVLERRSSN